MIRRALQRLHQLLGLTVGVVLSVMGVTGAVMSFDDEIMTASSHGIVDVPVRAGVPLLSPQALLARFSEQFPNLNPTKLTLFTEPGRTARLIYGNGEGTYLDPYTGQVLGKAVGETFFDTVRLLHRYLLMPHNIGKSITAVAAAYLVFAALSGLYLRWPARPWFKPDFRLRGRNFQWSLHSVAGTWALPVFLVLACTGLLIWSNTLVGTNTKAAPATVSVRYLLPGSPLRAYDEIVLDRLTGKTIRHNVFARQPLGKQLTIGLLAVHRGKVFGVVGALIFMGAALIVPFLCATGYLMYLHQLERKRRLRLAETVATR